MTELGLSVLHLPMTKFGEVLGVTENLYKIRRNEGIPGYMSRGVMIAKG